MARSADLYPDVRVRRSGYPGRSRRSAQAIALQRSFVGSSRPALAGRCTLLLSPAKKTAAALTREVTVPPGTLGGHPPQADSKDSSVGSSVAGPPGREEPSGSKPKPCDCRRNASTRKDILGIAESARTPGGASSGRGGEAAAAGGGSRRA
jgi:hypothetical protein